MRDSLAVAIEALSWMAYSGLGERTALFKAAGQLQVTDPNELRQAHRLIMETTRFRNRLEYFVAQAIGKDLTEKTPHGIRSYLCVLAYLKFERHASGRELERNVSWARQILGWKELQPYERAIAKLVSNEACTESFSLSEFDRLSNETCHPKWFVERLVRVFGRDFALRILRRNLRSIPTYLRLNSLKVHAQSEKSMIGDQIGGVTISGLTNVWRIERSHSALAQSNLLSTGEAVIQDLASIITGLVTASDPSLRVLDVCAAPGNKTSHLAELMQNQGEINSIDLSEKRLSRWKQEMRRTGVTNATPIRADARRIPIREEMDVVLVDPPCSNTGVFARNPSAKWKTSPGRIHEHALKQYSILQAASEHVKPKGTLVYCTCSILPEENEYVIEEFLRHRFDFRVVPQRPFIGSSGLRGFDLCQRFYPHLHECNGYFIARLQKSA